MLPKPWLWKNGTVMPIWRAFLITIAWAGSIDQFTMACTLAALTFVTSAVRCVAALSYTSLTRIWMPFSGASFSICSLPALPNPVLLESTPILEMPIFFICWKILMTASLSFWGVLNTYLATGFTITSAAAQEIRIVFPSSAMFLIAMVSPLVDGPRMANTFSSSISCLAKETAFSGLPPESFMINSILLPLTPPFALMSSTSISRVFASGAPKNEAGPDTARMAPTLIVFPARVGVANTAMMHTATVSNLTTLMFNAPPSE